MLRSLKTPNTGARLLGFAGTTAASAANTIQIGSEEGTFTNATSDEQLDLALEFQYEQAPIVVCTPGADIADGGTAHLAADPAISGFGTVTVNGSAAADVGSVNAIAVGWDDRETVAQGGKNQLQWGVRGTSRRRTRIVAGQVSSAGGVAIGGSTFTVADNGTGDHTITLTDALGRDPIIVATPVDTTAGYSARVETVAPGSFQVLTFDGADAAVDTGFNFFCLGWDSPDEHKVLKGSVIEVPHRKPRLLAFHIAYSAGTPSLVKGSEYGTVADTALGQATLTFTESFDREPVVIASAGTSTNPWVSIGTSSSTAVRVDAAGATGTAGDPDDLHVLVLGYDDATEY